MNSMFTINEPTNKNGSNHTLFLEKLFLKLALIQKDDEIQNFLAQNLCRILVKFNSPDEQVRKTLMELLTHLKKRLTDRPNIVLPLFDLFNQLQREENSQIVVNFSIVFIRIGLQRCSEAEKGQLFPVITESLRGKSTTTQKDLMPLLIPMLPFVKYEGVSDTGYSSLPFTWSQFEDVKPLITEYLYYYLLLPYNISKFGNSIPPGYSQEGIEALKANNNNLPIEDGLEEVKLSILEFLTTKHFDIFDSPQDCFILLVVASGDSRVRVKEKAEKILMKIPLTQWLGTKHAIKSLYTLFLGGPMRSAYSRPISAERAKKIANTKKAKPVDLAIKMKVFDLMKDTPHAYKMFPDCIEIVCQSLHGNATNKQLMQSSLQFAHRLCETDNKKIPPLLENALVNFIRKTTAVKLKQDSYKALGNLAYRKPQIFKDKLQFFQSMFESLMVADQDLGLSIYECISLMTDAFKSDNEDVQKILEDQFPIYLEEESSLVRLATIRCCHRIFAPTHALSRYLMLIGAGDTRGDVRDEADRGLSLEGKKKDELPNFNELVLLLVAKGKREPFKQIVLVKILVYLEQLILKLSGADNELMPSCQVRCKELFFQQLPETKDILHSYLELIKYGLTPGSDSALNVVSLKSLKSVIECIPEFGQETECKTIAPYVGGPDANPDTKPIASAIAGLITRGNTQRTTSALNCLLENPNKEVSLLPLGYVLGYAKHETLALINKACLTNSLDAIAVSVNDESSSVSGSACESLSIILAHHLDSEILKLNLEEIFEAVSGKVNSSKSDISCKESGFQLLGILAVCCRREEFLKRVCDCLLKQHTLQGSDLHLGIAESLSMCVVGNRSKAFGSLPFLHDLTLDKQTPATLDNSILKYILESIFQTLTDDRVVKRNYAVPLWLLSLLQLVIVPFELFDELEQIHTALLLILFNTTAHLSQESVSIGLYVIHRITGETMRKKLLTTVEKCAHTTLSRKQMQELRQKLKTKGTKGFKMTVLDLLLSRKVPENYKELFNLSHILEDTELSYPLINLARQCTICKRPRAQKLDLNNMKDQCVALLEPKLPRLIPKLYYFIHAPNDDLRNTMFHIWSAFVRELTCKTVEQNFKAILKELIELLGHRDSTYRQGSCACLRDILHTQPFRAFSDYLPELWRLVLINVDDTKETIRQFACMACDNLAMVTIKNCDAYNSKELAEKNIKLILPMILKNALNSKMPRVRAFCQCITRVIANNTGELIKPFTLDIIPALLCALSDLECNALSEMSVRADQDQISQERVESIRLQLNSCSPIMETIKTCIKYVDSEVLKNLVPRLIDLTKDTTGLNTKIGCAKVVEYLTVNYSQDLVPHSQKLIHSLMGKMNERSLSIKKTYASSISQLAKIGAESIFENLINKIRGFYLDEDSDQQLNACLLLQALNKNCIDFTDKFKSKLLPLVYFALHDKVLIENEAHEEDSARHVNNALWEEIWDSLAPYKERSLVLYLDEVMTILQQKLEAPVWKKREQSLKALINLAEKIPEEFSINQIDPILAALMKSLPGRVWEGKVHLPRGIELLTVKCSEKIKTHGFVQAPSIPATIKTLLTEASRSNELQQGLIRALGSIIEEYKSDKYPEFFKLSYWQLQKLRVRDANKEYGVAKTQNEFTITVYSALAKVFPKSDQKGFLQDFFTSAAQLINLSSWKVHLAVLESLGNVCDKIETEENPELVVESISLVLKPVIISTGNQNYSAIRGESLKVLLKLLNLLETITFIEKVLTHELNQLLKQQISSSTISTEFHDLLEKIVVYFDGVTDGVDDMK